MTAPGPLTIDISFDCDCWPDPQLLESRAREMIMSAWNRQGRGGESEVGVLFSSNERIRELNRTFRQKDQPTNVLSFPTGNPFPAMSGIEPLGDIVLAFETTAREASESGRDLEAHMSHLVVHGFLHLLGYDHQDDSQAEAMEAEETRIMTGAGFDDPYGQNEDV